MNPHRQPIGRISRPLRQHRLRAGRRNGHVGTGSGIIRAMRIAFTKMQGAGNDFVVLDETRRVLDLTDAHYRFLADRHFGVGADQILSVRAAPGPQFDFEYLIHNADGQQVEHCGNGARCFLVYLRERGLSHKDTVSVKTVNRVLELQREPDGRVRVDMGVPLFEPAAAAFDTRTLQSRTAGDWQLWRLPLPAGASATHLDVAVLSMGNPHAVCLVDDVARADVAGLGPLVVQHPAFAEQVNAGFMQVLDRGAIALRVFERGAGETLSCGTGACAAVVAGIRLGLLAHTVEVATRGGGLTVHWDGPGRNVRMSGPAQIVFEGEIELPEQP